MTEHLSNCLASSDWQTIGGIILGLIVLVVVIVVAKYVFLLLFCGILIVLITTGPFLLAGGLICLILGVVLGVDVLVIVGISCGGAGLIGTILLLSGVEPPAIY